MKSKIIVAVLAALIGTSGHAAALYALKTSNGGSGLARQDTVLVEIDTTTSTIGAVNRILLAGNQVFADGLAMTTSGQLFAFVNTNTTERNPSSTSTAQLVTLNPGTGEATAVGLPISGASISGAGFDVNNRLYAINVVNKTLIEIDPETATVISSVDISALGFIDIREGDIAFDSDNNAYIATNDEYTGFTGILGIYPIDVATGAAGTAVLISTLNMNGLALVDNNEGYFLEENSRDEIHGIGSIDTAADLGVAYDLSATPVSGLVTNAGPMDLAAMPNKMFASNDLIGTGLDTPLLGIDVLANDNQLLSAAVAEIPVLDTTFTLVSAVGGSASYNGNTIDYTPPTGFTGTDVITYQVCLPSGSCATATLTIEVGVVIAVSAPKQIPSLTWFGLLGMIGLLGLMARRKSRL